MTCTKIKGKDKTGENLETVNLWCKVDKVDFGHFPQKIINPIFGHIKFKKKKKKNYKEKIIHKKLRLFSSTAVQYFIWKVVSTNLNFGLSS